MKRKDKEDEKNKNGRRKSGDRREGEKEMANQSGQMRRKSKI